MPSQKKLEHRGTNVMKFSFNVRRVVYGYNYALFNCLLISVILFLTGEKIGGYIFLAAALIVMSNIFESEKIKEEVRKQNNTTHKKY